MRVFALSLLVITACGGQTSSSSPASVEIEATRVETVDMEAADMEAAAVACPWRLSGENLVGPDPDVSEAFVVEVNLDDDGHPDLVANVGQCGNWGDCMFVLLRACEAGGYEALFGPEYAQNITFGEREEGANFAPVYVHGRTAMAGCDVPTRQALRHERGAWTLGASCADGEGIWDEECEGEPPPRCDVN